ncbi:hypothetical protein SBY92_001944 [Candida maltosa Xu316]
MSQPGTKFNLYSNSSSSLDEPPSPTNLSNNNNNTHNRSDKFHKSIKKSLNKLAFTPPNYSDCDIFERTCSKLNILNNPETPSHYNLENYTSPILDSATEILSNNVPLDQVKLNCLCEEEAASGDQPNINNTNNNNSVKLNSSNNSSDNSDNSNGSNDTTHHNYPEPYFLRPRARSILSQTLISTLDHKKIQPSASTTGVPTLSSPPLAKRSLSYAGQTPHSKSKVDANTIDFFSFADMVNHEEEEQGFESEEEYIHNHDKPIEQPVSPREVHPIRRGSYVTTISAKDYIGRI